MAKKVVGYIKLQVKATPRRRSVLRWVSAV